MRDRTHQMLDLATDLGVGYIDVARSYGLAELFLADWLERHPSSEMTIGSKWGYRYVGEWQMDAAVHEVKDHSLSALQSSVDGRAAGCSGGRLRLYQIHSATPDTGVLVDRRGPRRTGPDRRGRGGGDRSQHQRRPARRRRSSAPWRPRWMG